MDEIEFVHEGVRYRVTRDEIIEAMRSKTPNPIRLHGVEIEGRWFPVVQVFPETLGLRPNAMISTRARDLLSRLGFRVSAPQGLRNTAGPLGSDSEADLIAIRADALKIALDFHSMRDKVPDLDTVLDTAARLEGWLVRSEGKPRIVIRRETD